MTTGFDFPDKRQAVIDQMNAGRVSRGQPVLIPRQEHIVREFFDEHGVVADADRPLLMDLLRSNSV